MLETKPPAQKGNFAGTNWIRVIGCSKDAGICTREWPLSWISFWRALVWLLALSLVDAEPRRQLCGRSSYWLAPTHCEGYPGISASLNFLNYCGSFGSVLRHLLPACLFNPFWGSGLCQSLDLFDILIVNPISAQFAAELCYAFPPLPYTSPISKPYLSSHALAFSVKLVIFLSSVVFCECSMRCFVFYHSCLLWCSLH